MRHLIILVFILLPFANKAQSNFGVEGSLGFGYNGGEIINPLLIEGRLSINENISTSLGFGLWNSGYKNTWQLGNDEAFTIFHLSDSKALPTLQLGMKCQFNIFELNDRTFKLFVEPKIYLLPYSARSSLLEEVYYTKDPVESSITGTNIYTKTGTTIFNYDSNNEIGFYYGLQGGISTIFDKRIQASLGLGYTNLDLYSSLRGQTLHNINLNNYLPHGGMTTIFITLSYLLLE